MNEPASTRQTSVPAPPFGTAAAWAWPKGHWLGVFELQEVVACSAAGIVYRAWDHGLARQVAIKEYLPAQLAARTADGRVTPLAIENAAAFELGLQAFVDEARKLAQCDHPALVRVLHLLQAHGTVYRVMPWYGGHSLIEVRRDMVAPPNEAWLRGLLDRLLGALETYHRVGGVHGGLQPAQIQLLADGRALLLGPGAGQRALAGASAQAAIDLGFAPDEQTAPSAAVSQGPWTDFYALAGVARYCITGMMPPLQRPATEEPLAATVQRLFFDVPSVHYSDSLLRTLDAALSPGVAERPQSVAQFRERLDHVPREGVKAQQLGEAATPGLIQRVVGAMPPVPMALQRHSTARPEAAAPGAAPTWNAEITAERVLPTLAPQRRFLRAGSVVAVLGLAALMAWLWRDDLLALRVEVLSSQAPAAPAPASAAVAAAAPEVAATPAPVPEAPPAKASEPAAAPPVDDRSEAATAIPAPASAPAPAPATATATATAPAASRPRAVARAGSATPRALCGRRSDFSLYRCMQLQCSQPQWLQHPQCLQFRATDRVD